MIYLYLYIIGLIITCLLVRYNLKANTFIRELNDGIAVVASIVLYPITLIFIGFGKFLRLG